MGPEKYQPGSESMNYDYEHDPVVSVHRCSRLVNKNNDFKFSIFYVQNMHNFIHFTIAK